MTQAGESRLNRVHDAVVVRNLRRSSFCAGETLFGGASFLVPCAVSLAAMVRLLAQNPSLHLPNALFVRIARRSPPEQDLKHSKESYGCVECIITIRKSPVDAVRQHRIEFDARVFCPLEQ